MLNPTLTVTTLLFLSFAPAPDSQDIVEMTANFLVPTSYSVLLASDKPVQINVEEHSNQNPHKFCQIKGSDSSARVK